MDYMDTVLTEDLLAEEAADAQSAVEDRVTVDGIRRRFDRQVGLLRALPEGWLVYRMADTRLDGSTRGNYFTVYDARGTQIAQAQRMRAGSSTVRQAIRWGGVHGATAGDAWAQGIALMLAAIDAEAHGGTSEPLTEQVAP